MASTVKSLAEVTVYGSEGMLTVPNLWVPSSPVRNAPKALPPDTPIFLRRR